MKIKTIRSFKIIAIILSFLLIFEQSGFAQIAGELDISSHFLALRNNFIQERFRPLHLRYLSYDPGVNNFNLLLDKGDFVKGVSAKGAVLQENLQQETKILLDYFFVGISLPNEAFWVNLRPDAEDNIIDRELAETDVGRILLEADLQLKKDTANFTSPQTPEGKEYWNKLYSKAEELYGNENITIPTLTRPWIVPDEIIIRESSDNAYIYKATLKVMLEQDYLKDSSTYSFQDQRSKALNEYSSRLIRETIIPKLTKEVNSSKRYAPLRQVYYSLILAQWFKQEFYGKSGLYSYLIDRHRLDGLTSKTSWSKTTYFNSYKTSFQQGEYNIKEPRSTPYGQTIRSYMSGGLDLGQIVSSAIIQGAVQGNKDYGSGLLISKHGLGFHFSGGTASNPFGLEVDVVLPIDTDIPRAIGQLPVVGSPLSGNSPFLQKQVFSRSLISKNNETNFLSRALKNLSALARAVFASRSGSKRGALERMLNSQGINFKIDVSIGDIADDFMELSAFTVSLIPQKVLKECVSGLEFGADPAGAYTDADEPGSYSNEDKIAYVYQRSFAFWDAYLLARIILHEVGHGFEGGFSEEDAGKIKAAYSLIRQKILNGYKDYSLYLKQDDNILSLDNRKAIVIYTDKPDASQFIAEFFREFILNGEELRAMIQSQKDGEVKEALGTIYGIYKKRFNKEYYTRDVKGLRGMLERIPATVAKHIARDYKQFSEFRGVAGIFYLRYGLTLDEYTALAEKEGQNVSVEVLYKIILSSLASKTQVEFEHWKLKLASTQQALYDKLISVLHDYAQAITSMHSGNIDDMELHGILQDLRQVLLEIKTQSSPKSNEYILATEYAPIVFNVSLSALSQESHLPSLDDILSKQHQSAISAAEVSSSGLAVKDELISSVKDNSWKPVVPEGPSQYGILSSLFYRLDKNSVPEEFPIVSVVDDGLQLPDSDELCLSDKVTASRLKDEGIEFLSGELLGSKNFLNALKAECAQKGSDLKKFLKQHLIYAMSPSLLRKGESNNSALRYLREMLGDDIVEKYPKTTQAFIPLILSIFQKSSQVSAINFFESGAGGTSCGNTRRSLSGTIPLTKMLVYVYQLNAVMEEAYLKTNKSPGELVEALINLGFGPPLYNSVETISYALELLLAQWEKDGFTENAFMFFTMGLEQALESTSSAPYRQYIRRPAGLKDKNWFAGVTDDFSTIDNNLTKEGWLYFITHEKDFSEFIGILTGNGYRFSRFDIKELLMLSKKEGMKDFIADLGAYGYKFKKEHTSALLEMFGRREEIIKKIKEMKVIRPEYTYYIFEDGSKYHYDPEEVLIHSLVNYEIGFYEDLNKLFGVLNSEFAPFAEDIRVELFKVYSDFSKPGYQSVMRYLSMSKESPAQKIKSVKELVKLAGFINGLAEPGTSSKNEIGAIVKALLSVDTSYREAGINFLMSDENSVLATVKIELLRYLLTLGFPQGVLLAIINRAEKINRTMRLEFYRGINNILRTKSMLEIDSVADWNTMLNDYISRFGFLTERNLILLHRYLFNEMPLEDARIQQFLPEGIDAAVYLLSENDSWFISTALRLALASVHALEKMRIPAKGIRDWLSKTRLFTERKGVLTSTGVKGIEEIENIFKGAWLRLLEEETLDTKTLSLPILDALLGGKLGFYTSQWGHGSSRGMKLRDFTFAFNNLKRRGMIPELSPVFAQSGKFTVRKRGRIEFTSDEQNKFSEFSLLIKEAAGLSAEPIDKQVQQFKLKAVEIVEAKLQELNSKVDTSEGKAKEAMVRQIDKLDNVLISINSAKYDNLIGLAEELVSVKELSNIVELVLLTYSLGGQRESILLKNIMEAVNGDISEIALRRIIELKTHTIKDHTLAAVEKNTKAYLLKTINIAIFQKALARVEAISGDNIEVKAFATKGILGELAGDIGDACYTGQSNIMARISPSQITAVIFSAGNGLNTELIGSMLILENTINGKPAFILRAVNPSESFLSRYDAEDFLKGAIKYIEERVGGKTEFVVAPTGNTGALSNRNEINTAFKKFTDNEKLDLDKEETFNGYNITKGIVSKVSSSPLSGAKDISFADDDTLIGESDELPNSLSVASSTVDQSKENNIDLSRRKGIIISLATVLSLKILGPSKALAQLLNSDEMFYLHLAGSDPKKTVLDFKKYEGQTFAKNVLKAAINKNADVVLEHAEVFINETYAQELFELATQTWPQSVLRHAYQIIKQPYAQKIIEAAASKYPMGALEYSFNYAKQSYAEEIIAAAAKSEPVAALKFAKAYIEEPYAKGILEGAAKKNYLATLEYSKNYFNKQYMRPIIEQCVRRSAWGALRFASGYLDMPGARALIEGAAELRPDTAMRYSFEYMAAPYAKDIIIKSALQEPAAAIIETRGVGWVLEEKRKDVPEIDIILRIAASEYRGKQERIGALLDMIMDDIGSGIDADRAMYKASKISENDNEFFKELMRIKSKKSPRGAASVDRFLKRLSLILIRDMNDMHDLTAERRFRALNDYDAGMLYTMIVYGEDEVYTSTFNGIFNILVKKMKENNISGEKLLEMVGKNKFRVFIKLTAAFKRLNEFWDILEVKSKKDELIKEFVQGLAGIRIDNERLSQTIAVADTFSVINGGYQQVILREAIDEYKKMETAGNKEGVRVYGILIGIFGSQLSIEEPWFQKMYQDYPVPDLTAIDGSQLFDPNGAQVNTQVHFFYNDPDGKNSFDNFKKLFKKNEIKESPDKSFIVITKQRADKKIIIYANNPYTDAVKGQMQVDKALKERGIEPQVVVHRGHSFHLGDTIERITAKAKIVFLGACGGYNYIVDVLERAPLAHIVSTKGTGKNDVNNPLLDMLNNELLSGKGIQWEGFWQKAKKRLGESKDFSDYVPPHRNLGVLFLKTYYNVTENVSKTIPHTGNQGFLREIIDSLTPEVILPITVFNMAINKITGRDPMDRREFLGLGRKTEQLGSADSSLSREEIQMKWENFINTAYFYHGTSSLFKNSIIENGLDASLKPFDRKEILDFFNIYYKKFSGMNDSPKNEGNIDKIFLTTNQKTAEIYAENPPEVINILLRACGEMEEAYEQKTEAGKKLNSDDLEFIKNMFDKYNHYKENHRPLVMKIKIKAAIEAALRYRLSVLGDEELKKYGLADSERNLGGILAAKTKGKLAPEQLLNIDGLFSALDFDVFMAYSQNVKGMFKQNWDDFLSQTFPRLISGPTDEIAIQQVASKEIEAVAGSSLQNPLPAAPASALQGGQENKNGMNRRTFLGILGLGGLAVLLGLSDSGNAGEPLREDAQPEEGVQKQVDWDKARGFIADKLAEKYPEKKQAQDIKNVFGGYEKDKSKAYREISKLLNSMAKEMDKEQRIGSNSNGWFTMYFIYIDGLYENFGQKIIFPFGKKFAFLDSSNNQGTRKIMEDMLEEEASTAKKWLGRIGGIFAAAGTGALIYNNIIKPWFARRFARALKEELGAINSITFNDDGFTLRTRSSRIEIDFSAKSIKIFSTSGGKEKMAHKRQDSRRYYDYYGFSIESAAWDYIIAGQDKEMLLNYIPIKLRDNEYYGYMSTRLKMESLLKGIVATIRDFNEYSFQDLLRIVELLEKEERVSQQALVRWLIEAKKRGQALRSALDKLQDLLKLLDGQPQEAVDAGMNLLITKPYLDTPHLRVWLEDAVSRGQDKAKLVSDLNDYYSITRALLRLGDYENETAQTIHLILRDNPEIKRHNLLSWLRDAKQGGKDGKEFLSGLKRLVLINKRFIEDREAHWPRSGYADDYKRLEDVLLSQSGKLLLTLGGIYDAGYLNSLLQLYIGGYLSASLWGKEYQHFKEIENILEENINLIDAANLLELKKKEISGNNKLEALILAKASVDPSFVGSIAENIKKETSPQVNKNLINLLFSFEGAEETIRDILMGINPEDAAQKHIRNEYSWQWQLLEEWPDNEKSIARIMKKYPELLSKVLAIAKPLVPSYKGNPPYYKRHFPLIISAALSNIRELSVSADEFRDLLEMLNNWQCRPDCLKAISYAVLNNPALYQELLAEENIFDAEYLLGVKMLPVWLRMKLQRQFLEHFKYAFSQLRPDQSSTILAAMIRNMVLNGRVEARDLDLLTTLSERSEAVNTVFFCRELRKIGYEIDKSDYFTYGDFRFIHKLAQQPGITAFLRKLRSYGFILRDDFGAKIGMLRSIFENRAEYFPKIEAIRSVLPDFKYRPLLEDLSPASVLISFLEKYPSRAVSMMSNLEGVLAAVNPEAVPYAEKIREVCATLNYPAFLVNSFLNGSLNELLQKFTGTDDFLRFMLTENIPEADFKKEFILFLAGYTRATQSQFDILIETFRSTLNNPQQSAQIADIIGSWFSSADTTFSLPRDVSTAMKNISSGNMDNSDLMHVLANYLAISKALQQEGMQRSIAYKDVLELIKKRSNGATVFEDIPEEHTRNIEGLVYEAIIIWNKLLEIERAGKKQIVVANLSYGGVAVTPITEERNNQAYIVATQIPVWYTKVGSTPAHNNEYVLVPGLFTPNQIKFLIEEKPYVSVVDGSTSVAASDRSSPHIPDAFKGYRNYFIVLNHALGETFDPKDFDVDEEFVNGLLATAEAQELIKKIQILAIKPRAPNGYKFGFSYERKADSEKSEFLYLRESKKEAAEAKKLNINEALKQNNPFCIFHQSGVHPNDVDSELMPEKYQPCFFDDKDHFKQFYLDYEDGYGVVLSKRYAYAARELFRRFMLQKGVDVMSGRFTTDSIRPIDTLVLDLDGTLTEAVGGNIENGTANIINYLLKKGVRIIIITDDVKANVEKRIAKLDKSPNLVVFTDGGARADGGVFEQYNAKNIISPDLREKILNMARANFPFGAWKEGENDSPYRIQITDIQERTNFIERFQDLLDKEGIEAKVYKVGKNSARVTLAHKEVAFTEAIKTFNLDVSKSLIIADSARSYRIDRKLLTDFPESVSVNIGKFSPSIEKDNQRIVQYAGQGTAATKMLLSSVAFRGGLPQRLLISFVQSQPLEYAEAASSLTNAVESAGSALEEVNPQKISAALGKMEKQAVGEREIYGLAARLQEVFKWDDYFGNFTSEMWIELLRCKGVKELKGLDIKDGILIKQGDTVNDEQAMFLIEKGGVRVSEDAHGIWIADLEEGNYVGEIGAGSSNRLRTATVRIKEGASETKFLAIPMSVFSALGLSRVFSEISRQRSNRLKSRERLAEKDYTRILKKYPDTEFDEDSPVTKAYNLALKIINPKENPLSVDVTYHNPYHWNELLDFIDVVLQGMGDNLKNKNRKIIFMLARVAAYLHDIGYYLSNDQGKFTVVGHEDRSKEFVRNNMKELGLSSRYVNAIQFMIEHTKLKIGEEFENKLGLINRALAEMHNGKLSDKTEVFLKEILPDLDLNLASDLDFANDVLIAAKALAVADLYAATVDMVPFLWLEFTLEGSPAGKTTMLEQIAASRDFHKGVVEPQRLKLLLGGGFGLEKLIMDSGLLERLKSAREKNIGIMQQYAEAVKQIKAIDTAESVKKTAETNLVNLINGLDDDMVGPLKDELLAEVKTLVLKSSAVGAGSALQNPETGLIGSKTLGNYKFVLQGQGKEGYLLKIFGKRGVAGEIKFRLYNLPDDRKGVFVENVFASDAYRKDFRKDFEKGIYSNMLKEIIEIGEQYSRGINKVTEITGAINNLETLQGLYGAIAGSRPTEEREEVERLSGVEKKNYYEHTEPLIKMLKKAIIEEMGSEEGRMELDRKLPDTLLVKARSGGGFSGNHHMRVEGDQIILISNTPVNSAGSSLEMRPEEAAKLIREAAQENYEKWGLLSERLKTARRILVRVPGRDNRGGHEFPLGEIAATLPILIKALIISGESIEKIIVQCDSYPELVEALGENRVKLAEPSKTTDELRSIYSPDLVIDFDTVALGEEIPENTVKFPVAKLWMSLDRHREMREILTSAGLSIPKEGQAIIRREREKDGQTAIFVNPHSDSNKNDNVDLWVGLIRELVSRGYKVVLNSGKEAGKDQAHTKNILEKLREEVRLGDVKEFKGSITDLLNTFSKKIDGVVTIDSGIFHVVHNLYSLPAVVFTTSNTLGWIPQEKEGLLFKRVQYSDLKNSSTAVELLRSLLDREEKVSVSSPAVQEDLAGPQDSTSKLSVGLLSKIEDHMRAELKKIDDEIDKEIEVMPFDDKPHRLSNKIMERYRLLFNELCGIGRGKPEFDHLSYLMQDGKFTPTMAMNALQRLFLKENRLLVFSIGRDPVDGRIIENMPALSVFKVKETQLVTEDIIDKHVDALAIFVDGLIVQDYATRRRMGFESYLAFAIHGVTIDGAVPVVINKGSIAAELKRYYGIRLEMEATGQLPDFYRKNIPLLNEALAKLLIKQWPQPNKDISDFIAKHLDEYIRRIILHELTHVHIAGTDDDEIFAYLVEIAQTPYSWLRLFDVVYSISPPVRSTSIEHDYASNNFLRNFIQGIFQKYEPGSLKDIPEDRHRAAATKLPDTYPAGLFMAISDIPEEVLKAEAKTKFLELKEKAPTSITPDGSSLPGAAGSSPIQLDNTYDGLINRFKGIGKELKVVNLKFSEEVSHKLKTRMVGWRNGLKARKKELDLFFTNNQALSEEDSRKLNKFISGIAEYVEKRRNLIRPQEPLAVAEKILFTTVGYGYPYAEIDITSVPGAVRVYSTILAKSNNEKFRELMDEAMVRMQRILEVLNRVIEEGSIDLALAGRSGQQVVVVKEETIRRIYNEVSGVSSSPVEDEKGGIDMRSLTRYTKVEQIRSRVSGEQPQLAGAAPASDKEWQEIEMMASSGIAPSCERLREYLLSLQDPSNQIDKVLTCIADILRQEEEKACCTESSLREILILLESGRPVNELRLALAKIQVLSKEPQLIEQ
ncbi:MAG: HD domain-containing protein [Candidatus Omnitrophica bacterium]|nr:HD domain-containing protein [Candidatus Omnitrophota bacterium]